uniref:Uncharacterized protein n=1 Tax=Anguilla anguilla TaxID=7936 RepID=A0A0E9T7E0_ANGAN
MSTELVTHILVTY